MSSYLTKTVKSGSLSDKTQAIGVFNLFLCPFVIISTAVIICKTSDSYLAGLCWVLLVYSVFGIFTNLALVYGNRRNSHLCLFPQMVNSLMILPLYYWEPFFYNILLSRYKEIVAPSERRRATGVDLKSRSNQVGIIKLILSIISLCTGVTLHVLKVVPMKNAFSLGTLDADEHSILLATKNMTLFCILEGVCGIIVTSLMLYGNNHKYPEQGLEGVRLGPGLFLPYAVTVYFTYGFYLAIFYSSFGVPILMPYIISIIYMLYFFEIYFCYIVTWRRKEMLPISVSETPMHTFSEPLTTNSNSFV
ncbi:unnamed protein product [Meganyctiphanes norvegica]|uniref:Gustatory receptor n=1 Tax=Meganyctiphanes norvegica TaxID=48144 RepID=A0AAV2S6Y0_MEGNR